MITAHPGLPEFDYIKFDSLEKSSEFLIEHKGESRMLMGGTDVFVRMRDGVWNEKFLVDVKDLVGRNKISFANNKGITISAATTMNQVASSELIKKHYPLLSEAANSVASYQLRNRATLVGNICNSSPAGDTIGACLVFDAKLNIFGPNGKRTEPIYGFFKGPGKNTLECGEIVTSIELPVPPNNAYGRYIKLGRNKTGDLAIVGVTVLGYPNNNNSSNFSFRIAIASVAATPVVPKEAEDILASNPISEEIISSAAAAAMNASSPIDDTRGSARYRKMMVRNLTAKGIEEVYKKLL